MVSGRVWKFGDNINTDLMLPGSLAYASEEAQRQGVFSANRPGWVDLVAPGDMLIGGRKYGMARVDRRHGHSVTSDLAVSSPNRSMACFFAIASIRIPGARMPGCPAGF